MRRRPLGLEHADEEQDVSAAAAADGSVIGVAKMVQLEDIGADERKHAGRIAERVAEKVAFLSRWKQSSSSVIYQCTPGIYHGS